LQKDNDQIPTNHVFTPFRNFFSKGATGTTHETIPSLFSIKFYALNRTQVKFVEKNLSKFEPDTYLQCRLGERALLDECIRHRIIATDQHKNIEDNGG
jgi:hypothetical protein